jgi:RimJ/RimL family protein N-acetyltransferase
MPVTLRPLEASDLEAVHALLSDWKVVRCMLLPHCRTPDESRKYLDELMADHPGQAWQSVTRAIAVPDSRELVGLCGIAVLRGSEQGEIWYLVRPDHWGRGIAAEAARQLLDLGFATMNLHRIFATCVPDNPASARVLRKVGMREEGRQVKNLKIHGVWRDSLLYAILREEWQIAEVTHEKTTAVAG